MTLSVGKITSLDTSLLRASMKPGWEDLVRRCIQRFHLQNDGEMSFAKRHQQEGERERPAPPVAVGVGVHPDRSTVIKLCYFVLVCLVVILEVEFSFI